MFRSQTSDNMDRWKAEVEQKKREEQKREDQRRERVRRNKMQVREKVYRKVAKHCVFQWFVAPEGRKVDSLKRRVRRQLARWDEELQAVVVRSTFPSQNVQNTTAPDHFWKLRCRKKCTQLWREAHFQVKMYKAPQLRTTFGSWDVEKVHAVVARSTFRSQNVQSTTCSSHF